MHYDNSAVAELLDGISKPYETEVVELKEAKSDFSYRDLGRYFSALSNEALLRDKRDAWLFFGIDNDKTVCGTRYRTGDPAKLQSLKREMAANSNQRLTFREIHELQYEDERVIAFQIPQQHLACLPHSMAQHGHERENPSRICP